MELMTNNTGWVNILSEMVKHVLTGRNRIEKTIDGPKSI